MRGRPRHPLPPRPPGRPDGGVADRGGRRPARARPGAGPRPARRGALGGAGNRGRRRPPRAHDSGDVVRVGDVEVELVHTPGHTPGSQCFLVDGRLVSGDTLFLDGCGRTDLPGGDPEAMYESLTTRLARVPDDTVVFPGHLYSAEPSAVMGETRRNNFVFRPRSADEWLAMFGRMSTPDGPPQIDGRVTPRRRRHGRRGRRLAGRAAGGRDAAGRGLRGPDRARRRRAPPPLRPPAAVQAGPGRDLAARTRRAGRPREDARPRRRTVARPPGRRARRRGARGSSSTTATVWRPTAWCVATGAHPRHLPGTEGARGRHGAADPGRLPRPPRRRDGPTARAAGGGGRGRLHRLGGGGHLSGARVRRSPWSRRCPCRSSRALGEPVGAACGAAARAPRRGPAHRDRGRAVHRRAAGARRRVRRREGAAGAVELADGSVLPADVVVVGIGVVPTTRLARRLGLEVDDGVVCDPRCHAADGVVAAGDLARWLTPPRGRRVGAHRALGDRRRVGGAAARSLLAGRARPPTSTPCPTSGRTSTAAIQVLGHPAPTTRWWWSTALDARRALRRPLRPRRPLHGRRSASAGPAS